MHENLYNPHTSTELLNYNTELITLSTLNQTSHRSNHDMLESMGYHMMPIGVSHQCSTVKDLVLFINADLQQWE